VRRIFPPMLMLLVATLAACSAPAPQPRPTSPPATRRPPTSTATPNAAASAFGIVPIKIDESPLPPAVPTPPGFASGRATPTPFATPEPAWKYVTMTFAIENRSDSAWLVGIAGSEPSTTNLAGAVLTTRDGTRYKAVRSSTSFGLRTATSHALTNYPVLLRVPPGFRVTAESTGSLSVVAPQPTSVTFKVPTALTEYGTLSIPPLTDLGPKAGDDDISRRIRPLIGGVASVDVTGPTPQSATFPTLNAPTVGVGATVSSAGKATVTLVSVDASDPEDFELRTRGWKQVTLALQYRNDDPQQAHAFNVAAWLFGDDGVVYTGDAPSIGDFGRSLTPPDPTAIPLWDGRSAGTDQTPAGQALEPRRAAFVVPKALRNAVLVLAGDADAVFNVSSIPVPGQP
jgi:hypothetical protein